jgi:TRAP-type C4-dicarboxylate transport system permease large subunit
MTIELNWLTVFAAGLIAGALLGASVMFCVLWGFGRRRLRQQEARAAALDSRALRT